MNCKSCGNPIDEHVEGLQLNRCIYDAVFGNPIYTQEELATQYTQGISHIAARISPDSGLEYYYDLRIPRYSGHIEYAWDIVEELDYSIWCAGDHENKRWAAGYWLGHFRSDLICYKHSDDVRRVLSPICNTAPMAICLAALKKVSDEL